MSKWVCFMIFVQLVVVASSCAGPSETKPKNKTFDGTSSNLKKTVVVPTLDSPMEKGQNVIWCSSFLAAWKGLAEDIAKENIQLEGDPAAAGSLNKADDPRQHVPAGSLYVAVGWNQKGIVEKIQKELAAAFPTKPAPAFPDITDDSFVAYSYLEANVKFQIPYFQNHKPLNFTDSQGRKTNVASFGVRRKDDYAYFKLRDQPHILFQKGGICDADHPKSDLEFAIDLCAKSSPSQIIVARMKRKPTLAAALRRIEKEEKKYTDKMKKYSYSSKGLGPNDVLLVPDLFWQISHRFAGMEGKDFLNANLKGQHLDVAQQDILFRLDRSGAEIKSESKMYCEPIATDYILDRPFLICMKKRGDATPYFVMWVDNAELLTPWKQP